MTQITPKLIEQTIKKCNEHMKARGLSKKTRDSYESMIRRFLFWERENWKRIEALSSEGRLEAFLSDLANDKKRPISFSTQKSYFMAVLYFYREYMGKEIGKIDAVRAQSHQRGNGTGPFRTGRKGRIPMRVCSGVFMFMILMYRMPFG